MSFMVILNTLRSLEGIAINDHVPKERVLRDRLTKIKAIGFYRGYVVACDPDTDQIYSVNKLKVDSRDGMVHITRDSVGLIEVGHMRRAIEDLTLINN